MCWHCESKGEFGVEHSVGGIDIGELVEIKKPIISADESLGKLALDIDYIDYELMLAEADRLSQTNSL